MSRKFYVAAALVAVCFLIFLTVWRKPMESSERTNGELRILMGKNGQNPFGTNIPSHVLESAIAPILGQLVYSSGNFEVEAGLVESWNFDFESRTYYLELRRNLHFHNGRPVTASDLEFSLVRHLIGPYGSWFRSSFSNIEGVETELPKIYRTDLVRGIRQISSSVLAVTLKSPNPSFMHSLARSTFSVVPIEALQDDYQTWKTYPVGAGDYFFEKQDGTRFILKKLAGSGPDQITYFTETQTDVDLSFTGSYGRANSVYRFGRAAGVTLLAFNYANKDVSSKQFRNSLDGVFKATLTTFHHPELVPLNQLLPRHFWGRIERPQPPVEKLPSAMKILVYDSGVNSTEFFSFLETLKQAPSLRGTDVTFIRHNAKYEKDEHNEHVAEISTIGADVMDPLVLFSVFRAGSPLGKYVPPFDESFELKYDRASSALDREGRVDSVQHLSRHFHENSYAIPMFERHYVMGYDDSKVHDLGIQNGSLIFYFERVRLK